MHKIQCSGSHIHCNDMDLRYMCHLLTHTVNLLFQHFEALLIKSTEFLRQHESQFYQVSDRATYIEREFDG